MSKYIEQAMDELTTTKASLASPTLYHRLHKGAVYFISKLSVMLSLNVQESECDLVILSIDHDIQNS